MDLRATQRILRRVGKVFLVLVTTLAVPAAVGFVTVPRSADLVYPEPLSERPVLEGPQIRADRPTVAIVLATEGANAADVLPPYEVFATTGEFNVLLVAPTSAPVPLTGGLDVVPDATFTDLDARLGGPPEVIVVPQLHGDEQPVIAWLQRQAADDAPLILSVCVGAGVLADAGLLQDRPATSNWLGLIGLRRSHPEVDWQDGVRFVDDGDIVTSGAVLSGIDGSLRVVERLSGPDVAEQAARAVSWDGYRPGGPVDIATSSPRPADLVALLNAAYRTDRPTNGVLLTDGVGEVELASVFRPYTELSYLADLETVTHDGGPIRSRHGLRFVPRADFSDHAEWDRLLVPGAEAAVDLVADGVNGDTPVVYLHDGTGFAFDATARDIAATYDGASARWVVKSVQFPPPDLSQSAAAWPWRPTVVLLVLLLAGAGIGLGLIRLVGAVRVKHHPDQAGVAQT